jgi:putative ABC transport system substrate-binding protein
VKRRQFITLLGGAAASWPLAARAQHGYRSAGADAARIKFYAVELVGAPPDVILAITSPSVAALRQVTNTIPIVFVAIGDPVGQGFVASLARPGGNITGFTGLEFSLGEKWLGFLKGLTPDVTRVAFLFHPELGPFYSHWLNSVEAGAANLGVETTAAPVRTAADVERVISATAAAPNGGLVVQPDAYTLANRRLIIELARDTGCRRSMPIAMTLQRAASFPTVPTCATYIVGPRPNVDRILKGEKPADLPVQQPLKYELTELCQIPLRAARPASLPNVPRAA